MAAESSLASWNETPTRASIVQFVKMVTDPDTDWFLPPEERVAVFDNDGTLWSEKPMPIQLDFTIRRFGEMASQDPALQGQQPWKAAYEKDFQWFGAAMVKHYQGDDSDLKALMGAMSKAFEAVSISEYSGEVSDFFENADHPTLGRPYRDCGYKPMVELLRRRRPSGAGRAPSAARRGRAWCACDRPAASPRPGGCRRPGRTRRRPRPPSSAGRTGRRPTADPGLDGIEVALHQVGATAGLGVGPRGAPRPAAALGAVDRVGAHQALHAAAWDRLAGPPQRLPHPAIAVGVVVGRVERTDASEQPLVLDGPLRARPVGALVVGGRRHAQDPADGLDAEALAMRVDKRAHFGRSGSSSLAKNTDADLRISFARRNS